MTRTRVVIGALACAGVVAWGVASFGWGWHRAKWQRIMSRELPERLAAAEDDPPHGARQALAVAYSRLVFPPNHDRALELVTSSIPEAPTDAVLWLAYAREALLSGHDEEARIALTRSDELDPRHPGSRIEAVRLWDLLGERDRALTLAAQTASLNAQARRATARELSLIGISTDEIARILKVDDLSPIDVAEFFAALRAGSSEENARALASVKPKVLANPDARRLLAEYALDPVEPGFLWRVWEAEIGRPMRPTNDTLPLADPRLLAPPFHSAFPLGWLRLPDREDVRAAWISPSRTDESPRGSIEYRIAAGVGSARITVHRLVAPAGGPHRIGLVVRGEGLESLRVDARLSDGQSVTGQAATPTSGSRTTLWLTIPARANDAVVEFVTVAKVTGGTGGAEARLFVLGFEDEPDA